MNVVGGIPTRNAGAKGKRILLAVDKADAVVIGRTFGAGGIVPIGPPLFAVVCGVGVNRQFFAGFVGNLSTHNSDFRDPKEVFASGGKLNSHVICTHVFKGCRKIDILCIVGGIGAGSLGTNGREVYAVGGNREFHVGAGYACTKLIGTYVRTELINIKGAVQGNGDVSLANGFGERETNPSGVFIRGGIYIRIAYDDVVGQLLAAVGIGCAGFQR